MIEQNEMNNPELVKFNSQEPFTLQVANWMLNLTGKQTSLDFSGWLVLVPTRNAGRLLREQLALCASKDGRALLAPKVLTPGALLAQQTTPDTATGLEWRLAWMHALEAAKRTDVDKIFPHLDTREEDDRVTTADGKIPPKIRWTTRQLSALAELFVNLCDELAEVGLDPAKEHSTGLLDAVRHLQDQDDEVSRWNQITSLAKSASRILSEAGLKPPTAGKLQIARGLALPPARLVLAGLLHYPPVIRKMLEVLPASTQVSVLLFTPGFSQPEAVAFDPYGMPNVEFWTKANLPVEVDQITVSDNPRAMAFAASEDLAVALEQGIETPDLAICDPSLAPGFVAEFEQRGAVLFDPAGIPVSRAAPIQAIELLASLQSDPSMRNTAAAARHPAVLRRLAEEANMQPSDFLSFLDNMARERIPVDLEAVVALGSGGIRSAFDSLQNALNEKDNPMTLIEWVWPSGNAKLPPQEIEILRILVDLVQNCRIKPGECFQKALIPAAIRSIASQRIPSAVPDSNFVELNGWLETAWLPAQFLIVAGANDGLLPDQVDAHPFLPDALKQRLGLQTNAMRHARDAVLLRQLLGKCGKGLRLHLSKSSQNGEPLLPSRLLMQTQRDRLTAMMRCLFRETSPPLETPPRSPAWKLRVPLRPPAKRLRVTAFRDFLSDPLLFHFRHQLAMEGPFDPAPIEADLRSAGSLFHTVMKCFCDDESASSLTDAKEIASILSSLLECAVERHFGKKPGLPLRIQAANLKNRLFTVANIEAASRRQGWKIVHAEFKFKLPRDILTAATVEISGTIDRIEKNEKTGEWRILDYKTGKAQKPIETHLRNWPEAENWPNYCRVDITSNNKTKTKRWIDLQLPLYTAAVKTLFPEATSIKACYLNAPAEPSETAIVDFEGCCDLTCSAMKCAEGIITDIQHGNLLFAWQNGDACDFENFLLRDLRPDNPPELLR